MADSDWEVVTPAKAGATDSHEWESVKPLPSPSMMDRLKSGARAMLPQGPPAKMTPENVEAAVKPSPTTSAIEEAATMALAGGPAASAGEAVLGPAIGGVLSRSAGLGAAGAIQSLVHKPTDASAAAASAGWNFAGGLIGEGIAAGLTKTAEAVGPYATKIAGQIGNLTGSKLKALYHIKEFLKAAGRTPEEVEGFTRGVKAQQSFADAHQKILDVTHDNFSKRYDEVLATPAAQSLQIKTTAIRNKLNEQLTTLEDQNRVNQLSPGVQSFIKKTQADLDPLHAAGYKAGSIPAAGSSAGADDVWNVDKLRSFQSALRKQMRGKTTATDRAVLGQIHDASSDLLDRALTVADATPEDLGKLRQTDQDYRRFRQTMDQIGDPRQALTGNQAAKAIFDAVETDNAGAVDEYIKLAKAANEVHPEVMPQLKDAVLTKMFADAREAGAKAQTGVFGRVQSLRKQQNVFANVAPETVESLFGKGSPMADVGRMDQVFGKIASPEAKQQALASPGAMGGIASMLTPRYMARFMLLYGTFAALSGSATSPWQFPRKHPAAGIAIGLGMLYGDKAAKMVYSNFGVPAQRAYTNWILKPDSSANLRTMVDALAANSATIMNPSPSPAAARP